MPRILHTAYWQIGRLYGSFEPDDAVPLAEARFAAVERLAALATSERVDAVVVAGDVFDAQTVSARSIRRLFNALEGYGGPWIMIPGNHDAALAESVWTHAARLGALPSNVHLALEPRVIELPEPRIAFLCAPLTQRHTYGDLTEWFDGAPTPTGWLLSLLTVIQPPVAGIFRPVCWGAEEHLAGPQGWLGLTALATARDFVEVDGAGGSLGAR